MVPPRPGSARPGPTARANGFLPEVVHAVLGDTAEPSTFYVHPEFWASSLEPAPGSHPVQVPGRSLVDELERTGATYLLVDIEGGEVELLDRELPPTLRAICVEVHPGVVGHAAITRLLRGLMEQAFLLDTALSGDGVVFLSRR